MPGGIHPPLSVIETWPTPNYVNPVTASSSTAISAGILGVISLVVVGARMVARFSVQRNAGIDDYLMLFALVWKTKNSAPKKEADQIRRYQHMV